MSAGEQNERCGLIVDRVTMASPAMRAHEFDRSITGPKRRGPQKRWSALLTPDFFGLCFIVIPTQHPVGASETFDFSGCQLLNYSTSRLLNFFSLTTPADVLEWRMLCANDMQVIRQFVLTQTSLPVAKLFSRGKVRDVYEAGTGQLAIVATDRLSAFDVVMGEGIPGKGWVLTQLSCFWFEMFGKSFPNHFLSAKLEDYPSELRPFADQLEGRSMLVRKTEPFPIECVVRGYLAGSGLKEYRASGTVCGIKLPAGLREGSKFEQPIFTPATKAATGHDENITWEETVSRVGRETAQTLRDYSLDLYSRARDYAAGRGIIIADTKFEWGGDGNDIILIDEVLTPDSSRFWPRQGYQPGKPQPSFARSGTCISKRWKICSRRRIRITLRGPSSRATGNGGRESRR